MSICKQVLTKMEISEIRLLELLDQDVREIFSTMVGMEVSSRSTTPAADSRFKNCVSAMICLSGGYLGAVSIHAPPAVAIAITSKMLEMEIPAVDADVTDALGEIANMIAGSFKHHIAKDGHEMRLTPPTVIARNELFRPPDSSSGMLALLFDAGKDQILVTVNLEVWD